MPDLSLTKLRFQNGLWEGVLRAGDSTASRPEIAVSLDGVPVSGVVLADTSEAGRWVLEVPVPRDAVGDCVQVFLIQEARDTRVLASFAVMGGEALDEDLRAEVALLRAELDMLKRAFRRHCREG